MSFPLISRAKTILGRLSSSFELFPKYYNKKITSTFNYVSSFFNRVAAAEPVRTEPNPFSVISHIITKQSPLLLWQVTLSIAEKSVQLAVALRVVPEFSVTSILSYIRDELVLSHKTEVSIDAEYNALVNPNFTDTQGQETINPGEQYPPIIFAEEIERAIKIKQLIGISGQIDFIKQFHDNVHINKTTEKHALLVNGPVGVGKTSAIKSAAISAGYEIMKLPKTDNYDMYVGQAANRVEVFFRDALLKRKPVCLLLEGLETYCPKSSGRGADSEHRVDVQIADAIKKGIESLAGSQCVLIAETSNIGAIPSLLREEFRNAIINIRLPNSKIRLEILRSKLSGLLQSKVLVDENGAIFNQVVQATDGWSSKRILGYINNVLESSIPARSLTLQNFIDQFEISREEFRQDMLPLDVTPPKLKFDAVAKEKLNLVSLQPDLEHALSKLCSYLENPAKYESCIKDMKMNLLLSGPPGTGKTTFARYVAEETGALFINLSAADILSGKVSSSEAFNFANRFTRSVIFIDEIDAVLNTYSDKAKELQTAIDGFKKSSNTLVVIGATNFPDKISQAGMDRFMNLDVHLPNLEQRAQVIKHYLLGLKNMHLTPILRHDIENKQGALAKASEGLSQRYICDIINQSASDAIYNPLILTPGGSPTLSFKTVQQKLTEKMNIPPITHQIETRVANKLTSFALYKKLRIASCALLFVASAASKCISKY